VRSLAVQNPAGVTLSAPLAVVRVLRLTQGNLNLAGQKLTLLSEVSGTALGDNTGSVVSGTATVQRYLGPRLSPATGTGSNPDGCGYRHYSAPVSKSPVADLMTANFTPLVAGSTFATAYGYDESRLTPSANFFDQG